MDGIELLRNDHQRILVILNELITGRVGNVTGDTDNEINRQRRTLYDKLRELLVRHLSVEEELLFPGLRGFVETRILVDECCREHKRTVDLLGRNEQLTESTKRDNWDGFLLQLERHIQSHVEREEDWLFPRARLLLGDAKLEQMLFDAEQVTGIRNATEIVAASADSLVVGIPA